MIVIPFQQLSAEALQGLLEEYVSRDGTDYGEIELTLTEKVARGMELLKRNEVHIVYDEITQDCNIVTNAQLEI